MFSRRLACLPFVDLTRRHAAPARRGRFRSAFGAVNGVGPGLSLAEVATGRITG
jgi:hypothetical protein